MSDILVTSMDGFGDMIYTRPFIKALSKYHNVYLRTVLPKLFSDIPNIKFIKQENKSFRTQQKHRTDDVEYVAIPEGIKEIAPFYDAKDLAKSSIVGSMFSKFDLPFHEPLEWNLPDFSKDFYESGYADMIPRDRKIAIIRPATIRTEWRIHTRNAKPEYIAWVCKVLKEYGYFTISIADLEEGKEWLAEGIDNSADLKFHKGELGMFGTMHLISMANIVVGGSGFIIPTCASTDTPQFIIFGGRGMYDSPYKVYHPSMNMKKIGWALPQHFCRCTHPMHSCNKEIPTLESDLLKFLEKIDA